MARLRLAELVMERRGKTALEVEAMGEARRYRERGEEVLEVEAMHAEVVVAAAINVRSWR